jgi:hypothetical protein
MAIISAPSRLRQEDGKFEANLGYNKETLYRKI